MRIARLSLAGVALLAMTVGGYAQSYGYATYSALLNAAGTAVRSSGVTASSRPSTGTYNVTFSRPVNVCVFVASIFNASPGYATVQNKAGDIFTIVVTTYSGTGTATNLSFSMIVSCAS